MEEISPYKPKTSGLFCTVQLSLFNLLDFYTNCDYVIPTEGTQEGHIIIAF
jgi:hypothetical protein